MEELGQAIELAMQKFKEEFGEDEKLEEGDEFVTIFIVIQLEKRNK